MRANVSHMLERLKRSRCKIRVDWSYRAFAIMHLTFVALTEHLAHRSRFSKIGETPYHPVVA